MNFLSNDSGSPLDIPVLEGERVKIIGIRADIAPANVGDPVVVAITVAGTLVVQSGTPAQDTVGSVHAFAGCDRTIPMPSLIDPVTGAITVRPQAVHNVPIPDAWYDALVTIDVAAGNAANLFIAYVRETRLRPSSPKRERK